MSNPLNQVSPRLSASYSVSEKFDINANIGHYVMQPSYTTMGFRNASGVLVNQNENVRYIGSNHFIMGFEFRPKEKMKLSVEGFWKQYNNYGISVADGVSLASKGADYGVIGDEEILSTGKGKAYGVEFLFKVMEMEKLNVTATYTLFRSEFTDASGFYRPSSWDTKHLLNLISSYKFGKSWNVAMRWRYVGGAPYTPIDENLSTLKSAWDIQNQPYLDYDNYNSLRLKNSHILDLRLDKEIYFKKWLINLYTDIQNVYNFKSESAPIYTNFDINGLPVTSPTDNSRYVLRRIESFGGTILPTIGIIVKM
jgi:outer membrane receptor for ferrienterochelin and colicin